MEFEKLLERVGDQAIFETSLLLAGEVDPAYIRLQLTRWKNAGRVIQLRRGLYALAPPYQKTKPHPFVIANRLRRASYVSLQSALAFYGMIPENVLQVTSVTGGRPAEWQTSLGVYRYQHIKPALLRGSRLTDLGDGQQALVATPEKALLDWIYLQPRGDDPAWLESLRLSNLERLDPETLREQAAWFGKPKIERAVSVILPWIGAAAKEYETL